MLTLARKKLSHRQLLFSRKAHPLHYTLITDFESKGNHASRRNKAATTESSKWPGESRRHCCIFSLFLPQHAAGIPATSATQPFAMTPITLPPNALVSNSAVSVVLKSLSGAPEILSQCDGTLLFLCPQSNDTSLAARPPQTPYTRPYPRLIITGSILNHQ